MKKQVLSYLCCSECKGDLGLETSEVVNDRVKEGKLICKNCQSTFEIINFIPRFVDSELYVDTFGEEWNIYKNIKNSKPQMSMDEMKNYLGIQKEDIEDKFVLEVGCGAGPYLDISANYYKAKEVIGIDLSRAVDAAYENVGKSSNITIIQADLFKLPLKTKFDVVYSLGVLHHTPSTKKAFFSISDFVNEGGILSIWLYGYYWKRKIDNQQWIRKNITSKLSFKTLKALSKISSYMYCLYKLPIIGDGLRERVPIAMDMDREVRELNTFDMYSPKYINYHYLDEVYEWFENSGFSKIKPNKYILGMKGIKCNK